MFELVLPLAAYVDQLLDDAILACDPAKAEKDIAKAEKEAIKTAKKKEKKIKEWVLTQKNVIK